MKLIHAIAVGLVCSFLVAIVTWFTFSSPTVLHSLPFSPGLQIMVCLHWPEGMLNDLLRRIFHPHSPVGFAGIGAFSHFSYYLTIGALAGATYAWFVTEGSRKRATC